MKTGMRSLKMRRLLKSFVDRSDGGRKSNLNSCCGAVHKGDLD